MSMEIVQAVLTSYFYLGSRIKYSKWFAFIWTDKQIGSIREFSLLLFPVVYVELNVLNSVYAMQSQ